MTTDSAILADLSNKLNDQQTSIGLLKELFTGLDSAINNLYRKSTTKNETTLSKLPILSDLEHDDKVSNLRDQVQDLSKRLTSLEETLNTLKSNRRSLR